MTYKKRVIRAFNRGSERYDDFSEIQNMAGKFLLKELEKLGSIKNKNDIIELGSGTGILTKMINDCYSFNCLKAIDISGDMIQISKQKLVDERLVFVNKDFDFFEGYKKYNLILSNMSLHWSSNINQIIKKIIEQMSKDSILCFTFPNQESFSEVKKIFGLSKFKNTLNKLPSHESIKKIFINENCKVNANIKEIKKSYNNLFSFLKELKDMGVNTSFNRNNNILFSIRSLKSPVKVSYFISCFSFKK